jgi:hypothetical protein
MKISKLEKIDKERKISVTEENFPYLLIRLGLTLYVKMKKEEIKEKIEYIKSYFLR